jgi:N-carbamoyl-L-amino-acid hydrolase
MQVDAKLDQAVERAALDSAELFDRLRQPWPLGGVGRDTYGPGEQYAHDLIRQEAQALGLSVETDFAGNLWATLPGRDRSLAAWVTGSHLDSVPEGGNFDGAAGVVAGLAVIKALRSTGKQAARDIMLAAFRAEEASSWFRGDFGSHVGSRAALGLLAPQELQRARHVRSDRTLFECMRDAGAQPEKIALGHRAVNPERCHGFVELHIEQGPVLVERQLPVGVVTAIRGSARARQARVTGEDAHSGAVPHEYRHDAVLAGVELCHRLDRAWEALRLQGRDLVFTVGKMFTDPARHSITKVPGHLEFSIDLRSQDAQVLDEMQALAQESARQIAAARGVHIELGSFNRSAPARMDPALIASLESACKRLGVPALSLPSGAGHDAADFASCGVPSAMVFVRNDQGSHNPKEAMAIEDFAQGARVLAWQLMQ